GRRALRALALGYLRAHLRCSKPRRMILCMVTNQLIVGDCRMLGEEHCSYETRCLVSHPYVMAGR
ncbi:MAG: hypothetical protein WC340_17695, partial [Kiritimatiellia bacterium]